MSTLEIPTTTPDGFALDWEALVASWPWLRSLAGCPQDPVHHAEGDVWVHTRMVCEALTGLSAWRALPPDERTVVLAAALFHDIAKPACTRCDDEGRITAPGHSRRGEVMARNVLWRQGVPFASREAVARLVRYHQNPFFLLERPDARRVAHAISQSARCDHLGLLAESDMRGRVCEDAARVLDAVALFREYCTEEGCFRTPRGFANDVSRYEYFTREARDPDYVAWDQTRFEAVLMCGLPGSGKDRWIAQNLPNHEVVSLDDIRDALDAPPSGAQGEVIAHARSLAREHLRARRDFVWNATNLTRQRRSELIELFAGYGARVRIAYIEVPWETLRAQNRARERVVPERAIEAMTERWEVPDATEAHRVEFYVRDAD